MKTETSKCCEPFDPTPWTDQKITWENKLFIKDHVKCFLHIPLNMKQKITYNINLIQSANAMPEKFLMLSDESLWGSDLYIHVTKKIPQAEMTTLSGTFLTKVFEGPYSKMPKWVKVMKEYVANNGHTLKKLYAFYTTCPKCAKIYGKNYVVLLAQI